MRLAGSIVALALLGPQSAPAQGDLVLGRGTVESTTVRRNAERAARTFEQQRLRLIPNVPSSPSDVGDVIIGRYRYSAGDADDLTPPPAEPPAIGEARRALLRTLDSASRVVPGDEWIRSRLVWYSIEAGDTTAAIASARAGGDARLHALPVDRREFPGRRRGGAPGQADAV